MKLVEANPVSYTHLDVYKRQETLLERAKSLLIHAREAGRNRFCLDGDILLLEP